MDVRPIKTEADYQAALEEIERLFDAAPDTPEVDRLEVLATLVEAYEDKHYSFDPLQLSPYPHCREAPSKVGIFFNIVYYIVI
jgi:HTH-type transcriptional regulator/antitoxin HigA